ncbi:IPExxxVDY family protein [Kordia sp. YSTF-M3]|uniref:IPExxxVDY family protein n=1 Tax=Kordia aestuariivivens TaxID=2759037 RepID=A0ABR7Q6D1_9FLAO|nr:IPExxxVDY family protein [Kordia aestuariivivens]MBC8754124.1 IPExxxVDY family protein [Kordia aestuariivivens]
MAIHKLFEDDFEEDNYTLIAIHCSTEDYRLAYLLNTNLNLKLARKQEDLDYNYMEASFSIYEWDDEENFVTWNLVANTSKKEVEQMASAGSLFSDQKGKRTISKYLIPEQKRVDYFVKISSESYLKSSKIIVSRINAIAEVITAYTVNPNQLKSKNNLIFE